MDMIDEQFALKVNEEGHCERGRRINLSYPREVKDWLEQGRGLWIVLADKHIFGSCQLATPAANPHISLGCSSKRFVSLTTKQREEYCRALHRGCKDAHGAYAVFQVEVPDYFEDRFVFVDGVPYIDQLLPSGRVQPIDKVWVDLDRGGVLIRGVDFYEPGTPIGGGFVQYIPEVPIQKG